MARYDWNRGNTRDVEAGVEPPAHEDVEVEPKKVSITAGRIVKWGAIILGIFGAGYALRGWAESTNGTANLLGVLRGRKRDDGDLSGLGVMGAGGGSIPGMWPGVGRPPTPEELAYWSTFYKRGAAAVGELPPAVLPQLPTVEREPMPPVTRAEQAAERSLIAPSRPRTPRYGWQGGYSGMGGGGYSYDGFGGGGNLSLSGGSNYVEPALEMGGGAEEFTIVKED
jgi:hypothetical protein